VRLPRLRADPAYVAKATSAEWATQHFGVQARSRWSLAMTM